VTQSFHTDNLDRRNTNFDGDSKASAASVADPPSVRVPSEAEIVHFDVLLDAVTSRLQRAVDGTHAETFALRPEEAIQRLRTTVVECVEALQQLLATRRYARRLGGSLIK
jgi:hypothetical protein